MEDDDVTSLIDVMTSYILCISSTSVEGGGEGARVGGKLGTTTFKSLVVFAELLPDAGWRRKIGRGGERVCVGGTERELSDVGDL